MCRGYLPDTREREEGEWARKLIKGRRNCSKSHPRSETCSQASVQWAIDKSNRKKQTSFTKAFSLARAKRITRYGQSGSGCDKF